MSLRANTYVALTGVVFLAIALIFAGTLYAGSEMVHGVERNLATSKMHQVEREIGAEMLSIDTLTHDWGSWDDAVRFVTGKAPDFVAENVPSATLQQIECDAVYIQDLRGNRLIETYSPKLQKDPAAIAALRAATGPDGKLAAHQGGSTKTGVTAPSPLTYC